MLEELDREIASLRALSESPSGNLRITAPDHAISSVIWPRLQDLLRQYPELQIELSVDYALTDIVSEQYDAGIRLGSVIDKDMIAVRIGPDFRMAVVGSPDYFNDKTRPTSPEDLTGHKCINLRLPTQGGLYPWEFEKDGRSLSVRVRGQTAFNNTYMMLQASLDGLGLAYVPQDLVQKHLSDGTLITVLEDWCPLFPGYHLYYASRHHVNPALSKIIDTLRHQDS